MITLTWDLDLGETLRVIDPKTPAHSRFAFGSPCRWVWPVDVAVHIAIPELLERRFPGLCTRLRDSSPRWGTTWQHPA